MYEYIVHYDTNYDTSCPSNDTFANVYLLTLYKEKLKTAKCVFSVENGCRHDRWKTLWITASCPFVQVVHFTRVRLQSTWYMAKETMPLSNVGAWSHSQSGYCVVTRIYSMVFLFLSNCNVKRLSFCSISSKCFF